MSRELYLAKKSKRFLARLIDILILFSSTLIVYFSFIYNNVLDQDKINKNGEEIVSLISSSNLYLIDENGNYAGKSTFSYLTIDELSKKELTFNGKKYDDISLTKSLYEFYTIKYVNYGGTNLTSEAYLSTILKVGDEASNISSYDYTNDKLTLIKDDNTNINVTKKFILNAYDTAQGIVINYAPIKELIKDNQEIMVKTLSYSIYVFLGFSLIYELIIPLCTKNGKTIGKIIFKLGLVNKDGYEFKKWKLILRYLAFLVVDIFFTAITFGGVFLISFTMMQFNKKRRVIHDYVAGSVVIDTSTSIIFKSKKEEDFYNNRVKNNG